MQWQGERQRWEGFPDKRQSAKTRYERSLHITEIKYFHMTCTECNWAIATEGYKEGGRSQILQVVVCHEKKLGLYPEDIGWKEGSGD